MATQIVFGLRDAAIVLALAATGCADDRATDPALSGARATAADFACLTAPSAAKTGNSLQCSAVPHLSVQDSGQVVQTTGTTLQLKVGATSDGQVYDLVVVLRNKASSLAAAALRIDSATMSYPKDSPSEADPQQPALDCLNEAGARCNVAGTPWRAVVPSESALGAGQVHQEKVVIRYRPADTLQRSATVTLVLRGAQTDFGALHTYVFQVKTVKGTPRLALQPADGIQFGSVAPGTQAKDQFVIANVGDAQLIVTSLNLGELDATFAVSSPALSQDLHIGGTPWQLDPALLIAPGETRPFQVQFAPKDDKKKAGAIGFGSNDPLAPKLSVSGNPNQPCIKMTPSGSHSFGAVVVGGQAGTVTVTIANCGSSELVVAGIEFAKDAANSGKFTIDQSPLHPLLAAPTAVSATNPLKLSLLKSAQFQVQFAPAQVSEVGEFESVTLRALSNAFTVPKLKLNGVGVTSLCPIAKVSVVQGEEVIPQTKVQFIGDKSIAPGSKIAKYKWTAQQPPGSNQVFQPSPNFANPTFQTNAAGVYKFCLEVWDANGIKSCGPACAEVAVIPDEALHVELQWNTPADPDGSDVGVGAGADLDLHFAHPLAAMTDKDCDGTPDPWFSSPWDTFWFNATPSWGSGASTADDPSLDLDDTDGTGPENLNLAEPEGTVTDPAAYSVGVHYWHDHGYGASYATISIYVQTGLAMQISNVKLDPLDMWYVGKLNWPNTIVGGTKKLVEPCYQAGLSCPAKKNLMWQVKGSQCITPCYKSQLSGSLAVGPGGICGP